MSNAAADTTPSARATSLPVLLCLTVGVLLWLPVLRTAPNRLLSGQGQALQAVLAAMGAGWSLAGGLLAVLAIAALVTWVGRWQWSLGTVLVLVWAVGLVWWLTALVGAFALQQSEFTGSLGRTSLSGGFWLALLLAWLSASDALRSLQASAGQRTCLWALLLAGPAILLVHGALDALSALREYANRSEDFWRACAEHLHTIGLTTALTVCTAVPLGVFLHRRPRWAGQVFALLNLVQTIPSIAMFGVLMAALGWLGAVFPVLPGLGIHGIGLLPAVLALTFYSLLPLVRSTYEGLTNVPAASTEAARAMGLSTRQLLLQVEFPLAAPVILSGLKVMLIQTIGLTAVAALIGAGGLGALMFEGLFSSALDLVILAVVPIVVMAWCAEALFVALNAAAPQWIRH